LSHLCARDVVSFVLRQAPRLHPKRAKLLTSALRSFLRYVRYRGGAKLDLVELAWQCNSTGSSKADMRAKPCCSPTNPWGNVYSPIHFAFTKIAETLVQVIG
jgi:hypothetical protein